MLLKFKLIILFTAVQWTCLAQNYFELADSLGISFISQTITSQGSGVSFVDYDQDGWDDLTIGTAFGDSIFFLHNDSGTFVLKSSPVPLTSENQQVIWVDYDNDGDKDLYLSYNLSYNRLYRNDSGFTLVDVTAAAGLSLSPKESYGAAWADVNKDGWLDLYEVNQPNIGNGKNVLYLSNGNATFTDVTVLAGVDNGVLYSFMPVFFDYNEDGWTDLFVVNDRNAKPALYVNGKDSTFTDFADTAKIDSVLNGMGVAVGDYDGDGKMDIYLTNTYEGNFLYHNLGNGEFEEIADTMGVTFEEETWGALFLDYDQDGDLDLYVSGAYHTSVNRSSTMYRNDDTVFSEPAIGLVGDTTKSFSSAMGDINNDGFIDLVSPNQYPYGLQIWQSDGASTNHWIRIGLEGVISNRDAIGTTLMAYAGGKSYLRYTMCGGSYLGQNSFIENIGFGQETLVDSLLITWPNGLKETYYNLQIDTLHHFVEGGTFPKPLISTTHPLVFCDGDTVQATLKLNQSFPSMTWNNGDTTMIVTVDTAGSYYVVVTNAIGIKDTSNVLVFIKNQVELVGASSADTTGASSGSATVTVLKGIPPFTYQWNDPFLQTTPQATQLALGTYKVVVTDSLMCKDSVEVTVTSVFSLSEGATVNVILFPNPSSDYVIIHTALEDGIIKITNTMGVEVARYKLEKLSKQKIDVSELLPGQYYLEIETGNRTYTKSLVIVR